MKVKKYTTQPALLGITLYFDLNGNKVGESRPRGLFDRLDYYDCHGNFKGHSGVAPLGQRIYYDAQGSKTGTSGPGEYSVLRVPLIRDRIPSVAQSVPLTY